MRSFVIILLSLIALFFTSCEKSDQAILNELSGSYDIVSVELVYDDGATETLSEPLRMSFAACSAGDNQQGPSCVVTVSSPISGLQETINYQLQSSRGENTVKVFGAQAGTALRDELAFRVLATPLGLQFTRNEDGINFVVPIRPSTPLQVTDESGNVRNIVNAIAAGVRR